MIVLVWEREPGNKNGNDLALDPPKMVTDNSKKCELIFI